MNKLTIYPILLAITLSLTACVAPPEKDIPGLTSELDAAFAGHYGQSIYYEELAEEHLEAADQVLEHWQNDYYWNIDERYKAMLAAQEGGKNRLESERHLCEWLREVHGDQHHGKTKKHIAAYFKTGSAVPYQKNEPKLAHLAQFLQTHPDAKADVVAYTDTVGSRASNQRLSERRADYVKRWLIAHGAREGQLSTRAMGEAKGPANTPDQHNRVVKITAIHFKQIDCSLIK